MRRGLAVMYVPRAKKRYIHTYAHTYIARVFSALTFTLPRPTLAENSSLSTIHLVRNQQAHHGSIWVSTLYSSDSLVLFVTDLLNTSTSSFFNKAAKRKNTALSSFLSLYLTFYIQSASDPNSLFARVNNPSRSKVTKGESKPKAGKLANNPLFLAIQGNSANAKPKHRRDNTKDLDKHVNRIDSSLLGSKSTSSSSKDTQPSRHKNTRPDKKDTVFSSRPQQSEQRNTRHVDSFTSRTFSTPSNKPSFASSRNAHDSVRHDKHSNSSRSTADAARRSRENEEPAQPKKPKNTSQFTIKHASLPPLLVLKNLAAGTTADDVRVSVLTCDTRFESVESFERFAFD